MLHLRSVVSGSPGKRPRYQCFILNPTGVSKVPPGLKSMTTTTMDPPPLCQPSHHGLKVLSSKKRDLTQSVYKWPAPNSDKGA